MGFTNQTPNYNLPQYVQKDKPTYLGDFNEAMLKIDTEMKKIDNKAEEGITKSDLAVATSTEAISKAESAETLATTAQTTATNAQSTANSALSNSNEAKTESGESKSIASGANTTAEGARTTANTAKSTADNALSKIDSFSDWDKLGFTPITGIEGGHQTMGNFSKNFRLLNLFGYADGTQNTPNLVIARLPEKCRPKEEIIVQAGANIYVIADGSWSPTSLRITPDGAVKFYEQGRAFSNASWNTMLCVADTSRWDLQ